MDRLRLPEWKGFAEAAGAIGRGRGLALCAAIALTGAAIGSAVYVDPFRADRERAAADRAASRLPRPRPDEPLTTGSIGPSAASPGRSLDEEIEVAASQATEAARLDRLHDKAVLIARTWVDCEEVISSEVVARPGGGLTVRIGCANAVRFDLDEEEIETSRLGALPSPAVAALTDAEAVDACEASVRRGLPHPTSLQRSFASTGVARAPGSNPVVTFDFDALNGLGFPLALQAQCVFAEDELARLEVSPR